MIGEENPVGNVNGRRKLGFLRQVLEVEFNIRGFGVASAETSCKFP
jgi:hypothetical protein